MNPGQIIGNYEIVSYLGGGGMGEVWLAVDRRINREVAIKGLHPQLLKNEEVRSRFRNEAMTLAKQGRKITAASCNHPVAEHLALGSRLGVSGTPAIFFDGQLIPGYVPPEELAQYMGLHTP